MLNGIILLSTDGGWPSNYTVETNDGSGWIVSARIFNQQMALELESFSRSLSVNQLRINITKDQKNNKDEYTRISEV